MQAEVDMMKGRFAQASDKIMSKFKDLSSTIDDMEKSLTVLVKQEEAKAAIAAAAAVPGESRSRLSPPKSLARSLTTSYKSRNMANSS
jgi:hypothetical protein